MAVTASSCFHQAKLFSSHEVVEFINLLLYYLWILNQSQKSRLYSEGNKEITHIFFQYFYGFIFDISIPDTPEVYSHLECKEWVFFLFFVQRAGGGPTPFIIKATFSPVDLRSCLCLLFRSRFPLYCGQIFSSILLVCLFLYPYHIVLLAEALYLF